MECSNYCNARRKWTMKTRTSPVISVLLITTMSMLLSSIHSVESAEALFFDNFDDGIADGWVEKVARCYDTTAWQSIPSASFWTVTDGQYFCGFLVDQYGSFDTGVSTVYDLNLTDCMIEVKVRFREIERIDFNFRAGIVFGYTDIKSHYSFEISDEYNCVGFYRYDDENPAYGVASKSVDYPIAADIEYQLKIEIEDDTFTGYVNGQKVLSWSDEEYTIGKVGLRGRASDVFFDDFRVLDVKPPSISDVQNTPGQPTPDQAITVTAVVTDNIEIKEVILCYSIDGGITWSNLSMSVTTGSGYTCSIPAQVEGTNVRYYIEALDNSLNKATSNTYSYTPKTSGTFALTTEMTLVIIGALIIIGAVLGSVYFLRSKKKIETPHPPEV